MIYLLTTTGALTVDSLHMWEPSLRDRFQSLPYERLLEQREAPAATYIFADLVSMTTDERAVAIELWNQLARGGERVRLLNDPTKIPGRYEFLRDLHERGINDYAIYRAAEHPKPERFPVFIRYEREHRGSLTNMLRSQPELDRALRGLRLLGANLNDLIVVEFRDTSDEEGLFRRWGAYVVADQVIPATIAIDSHWVCKFNERYLPRAMKEFTMWAQGEPDQQLLPIFREAGIDYGRMDFARVNGGLAVWEINTNPFPARLPKRYGEQGEAAMRLGLSRVRESLEGIDKPVEGTVPISVESRGLLGFPRRPFLARAVAAGARRPMLAGALRVAGASVGVPLRKKPHEG